jgi:hypothetical protein
MEEQLWSSAITIPGAAANASDISESEGEGDEKVFSSCITSANGAILQLHILVKRHLYGLREISIFVPYIPITSLSQSNSKSVESRVTH